MSKRNPSGPSPRVTGRTVQVAVRLPKDLYEQLSEGGSITGQIVEALRRPRCGCEAAPLERAGEGLVAERSGD